MKGKQIRDNITALSLLLFVAGFVVFVVASLKAAYHVLLWAGTVAIVSFCVFCVASLFFYTSDELNRGYLEHLKRKHGN